MLFLLSIERLKKEKDFKAVFANSKKIKHKYLLMLYKSNELSLARLGIIVSKRYVKRAVERNCFKRIVRESFRHHKYQLKGLDVIVLLRSECSLLHDRLGKKKLRDDVDHLWRNL